MISSKYNTMTKDKYKSRVLTKRKTPINASETHPEPHITVLDKYFEALNIAYSLYGSNPTRHNGDRLSQVYHALGRRLFSDPNMVYATKHQRTDKEQIGTLELHLSISKSVAEAEAGNLSDEARDRANDRPETIIREILEEGEK